jgi:hypothetical protein
MTQDELNDSFRNLIIELSELGYKKTNIGRVIFGMSAFSQVSKFVAGIEDPEQKMNFGISPLSKIGDLLGNNLHLVYIPPNDKEAVDFIRNRNEKFVGELKSKIKDYLDNNIQTKRTQANDPDKLNRDVDDILSLLL